MRRARSTAVLVLMYAAVVGIWWIFAYVKRSPSSPYLDPHQLVQAAWTNRRVLWPNLRDNVAEVGLDDTLADLSQNAATLANVARHIEERERSN